VPVHVYDEHVERNVVVVHLCDEVAQFVVAIRPVARPPVAEGVARRQRHLARKLGIVAQCLLVVVAVGEEIPVLCLSLVRSVAHPLPVGVVEHISVGVVDECPSVAREESVFEWHLVRVEIRVAIVAVECAVGALQVSIVLQTRMPAERGGVQADGFLLAGGFLFRLDGRDAQVVLVEHSAAFGVRQDEAVGRYSDDFRRVLHLVCCGWVATVYGYERLAIKKLSVGCVFHAYCSVGNHGEAHVLILIGDVLVLRNGARGYCRKCCCDDVSFHNYMCFIVVLFAVYRWIASAVRSDCVRRPIRLRPPPDQIAFAVRPDCVRCPIRLRPVNDDFCFVCKSIVRYAFITRDVLQEVVVALLVVYLATVMLQTVAHHEIIYV